MLSSIASSTVRHLYEFFSHKTTYLKMQIIHHKTLKVIYQFDAS